MEMLENEQCNCKFGALNNTLEESVSVSSESFADQLAYKLAGVDRDGTIIPSLAEELMEVDHFLSEPKLDNIVEDNVLGLELANQEKCLKIGDFSFLDAVSQLDTGRDNVLGLELANQEKCLRIGDFSFLDAVSQLDTGRDNVLGLKLANQEKCLKIGDFSFLDAVSQLDTGRAGPMLGKPLVIQEKLERFVFPSEVTQINAMGTEGVINVFLEGLAQASTASVCLLSRARSYSQLKQDNETVQKELSAARRASEVDLTAARERATRLEIELSAAHERAAKAEAELVKARERASLSEAELVQTRERVRLRVTVVESEMRAAHERASQAEERVALAERDLEISLADAFIDGYDELCGKISVAFPASCQLRRLMVAVTAFILSGMMMRRMMAALRVIRE